MDKEHIFAQIVTGVAALLFLAATWTAPSPLHDELSLTGVLIMMWALVAFGLWRLRDKA